MSNTLKYKNYIGEIETDLETEVLYGQILFINDLITYEATTIPELKMEFEEAVDDYLETCAAVGKDPDKSFKGSFNVRMDPELHRKAALAAKQNNQNLNAYIVEATQEKLDGHTSIHHFHTIENFYKDPEPIYFSSSDHKMIQFSYRSKAKEADSNEERTYD